MSTATAEARQGAVGNGGMGEASFQFFTEELCKVFRLEVSRSGTGQGQKGLRQRECTVPNYSIDVHTRASQSSWNSFALVDAFLHGLSDYIVSFVSFHGAHYPDRPACPGSQA